MQKLCPCQRDPNGECPYLSIGAVDCELICKIDIHSDKFLEDWLTYAEDANEKYDSEFGRFEDGSWELVEYLLDNYLYEYMEGGKENGI